MSEGREAGIVTHVRALRPKEVEFFLFSLSLSSISLCSELTNCLLTYYIHSQFLSLSLHYLKPIVCPARMYAAVCVIHLFALLSVPFFEKHNSLLQFFSYTGRVASEREEFYWIILIREEIKTRLWRTKKGSENNRFEGLSYIVVASPLL